MTLLNTNLQQSLTEPNEPEAPINLDKSKTPTDYLDNESVDTEINKPISGTHRESDFLNEIGGTNEKDKLSKLDQIVQNLYSTHRVGNFMETMATRQIPITPSLGEPPDYDKRWRSPGSVCGICNKRLSNQYNLRVHMETHAGRRHACRACSHVSRSRDALRKHVAYRHAAAPHTL